MPRLIPLLLLSLVALGIPLTAAQEPAQPDSTFQLIDSVPAEGVEIGGQQDIILYFDRPVDCDSARAAITLEPAVPGLITCHPDEASVIFTPSEPFPLATEFLLAIGEGLRAQDGARLAEPVSIEFRSAGYLAVSNVLPANGASDVETGSLITVIFNRPVVPLVIAEDMADLPDPLTIDPPVEGEGEWLNTSIYVFRPAVALEGGAAYSVTVEEGLQAVDGAVLPEPYTWFFSTIAPAITGILPEDLATGVELDADIQVTFNQPMDRQSVENSFRLLPVGTTTRVPGTFEWSEDSAGFRFDPEGSLALDTEYEIRFTGAGPRSAGGGASLTGDTRFSFYTVPRPAIVSTSPFDGEEDVNAFTSFTVYFASPMDVGTIEDRIVIEPEPWREPDIYYSDWDDSYTLNFPIEPSTTYTITLQAGMEDVYGNPIAEPTVVTFTTRPYDPDVLLQVPGPVGFYNAYNDETRLFLLHRNVSQVDLEVYHVPLERFGDLITGDNYYNPGDTYRPSRDQLIRRWTILSDTDENQRRYELLNLGDVDATNPAAGCEGAPESHLNVGDTAVVVSDPDPLRARAEAPDGEILTLLYRDYVLPVVGGPECHDGLLWWEVSLRDGQNAWVAEGVPEERFLELRTAAETTPLELGEAVGEEALPPGIYFLRATSPETRDLGFQPTAHFLVVGTANLVMKTSFDSALVWATDVNTGEPIAGAPVSLYDEDFNLISEATTDGDGMALFVTEPINDLYAQRLVMIGGDHFGVSASHWSDGIEPYQFGHNYNSTREPYRGYLYTDRPVYRPGQPVYFRGVVRERDDVTYTPPDFDTIPVVIYNENNDVVYEQALPLTPFGTFSDTFTLDEDAGLGYYRIEAELPRPDPDAYYFSNASVGFNVAEYRLPEFQVDVAPEEQEVVQGSTIEVTINSRYFFGGAVSDAQVDYHVIAQPYDFDYEGPGYFSFADYDFDAGPSEFYGGGGGEIASGAVTTDAQGNITIEIPADLEDESQSKRFIVEAVVTDESGQAVAGRTDVVVHKGLIYVGVAPREYVATAGRETAVDLIAVDWESDPVPGQTIEVDVVERRWSSVQEEDEAGRTVWTWEVEEIPVAAGFVTTDARGDAEFTFVPPVGGVYKITATTRDARGNEVISAGTMWVSSTDYVGWRQQNSNRIDLIADRDTYDVGDTAEILIASPFQGATEALITVERGDVLVAEHITMNSNSFVYELPITEDFAPNAYVSVLLVKGVDETNPVAAFRMGIVQLAIGNERKEITIDIAPDVEQAGPGDTVTYTVRTTDYQGNPVSAEVGVALTDLAALSIADSNSGPILAWFYGEQGLSIRTATPLTINTDQLTQYVLDVIKGGGGGFGEGGIFDIREEFVDTAYWNATLVTGPNGEAAFDVTLPDNLTTWRLDARAVTSGEDGLTLVGQDTFDLLSTRPLLVRPVTPRFFVVGDEVSLAAVVNNNTGAEQDVEIALEGTGLTFLEEQVQTVTIPAGGRARVDWPVVIDDTLWVDLTFYASGNNGEYTDASKPPLGQGDERLLPVLRYEAPESVSTGGLLREGGEVTEAVALPRAFDVTEGQLEVSLQPSLAATTLESLEYLRNYPYQCVEQTVSRFLPNIMTYRALAAFDLADEELRANLTMAVEFALQRLYAQQHVDGGWGWFVQDSSNALVTAYALIGLVEAREQGFAVSESTIDRARDFLEEQLVVPALSQPVWRLNRQAFVLYALARSGFPQAAATETLYEHRERLSYYARAFLALTLHRVNPDDPRIDTLISDLVNAAVLSATGAHWEEPEPDFWNWNTDTRSTAIILEALTTVQPDLELIPNIVRWLMVARQADSWETTQETAWAVMALTDWMVASGELDPDYTYSLTFNGEALTGFTAQAATRENVTEATELVIEVQDMLRDEANRLVISRGDGDGVLYYTAHLQAFLPVPQIDPLNRGIIVQRRYTLLDDESERTIEQARVGDVIQVRLTIIAPNDLHYVLLEDPIPAGTDAVNPDLATSQQVGTQPQLNPADPLSQGWGWWWFSNIEFRDEKAVLFSTYLPAGTYEYVYTIRAGLPGVYNVIPPTAQEFYFPEVYGRGAGSLFTILPASE